jgi:hypothetical protein
MQFGPQPVFAAPSRPAPLPDFGSESSLALIHGDERLRLGAPTREAQVFFVKPKRAFEFSDRPPGFGPEFGAWGWESQAEGFGLISHLGRSVVALHEQYKSPQERVNVVIDSYLRINGTESATAISGDSVRYWFWEQGRSRLMLCVVHTDGTTYNITEAIGELAAMDTLRMSPLTAVQDKVRADGALRDRSTPTPSQ